MKFIKALSASLVLAFAGCSAPAPALAQGSSVPTYKWCAVVSDMSATYMELIKQGDISPNQAYAAVNESKVLSRMPSAKFLVELGIKDYAKDRTQSIIAVRGKLFTACMEKSNLL